MVQAVRKAVRIPVAVKLSPFYTSLAHFATQLDEAGADGLVLFNRFYQPDIDVEELQVPPPAPPLELGRAAAAPRWLAILSPQVKASLAVTGGVHTVIDAVKAVMAGAHAVQMVSALLEARPGAPRDAARRSSRQWLEEHEYDSLAPGAGQHEPRGLPRPAGLQRANYMLMLQSWRRTRIDALEATCSGPTPSDVGAPRARPRRISQRPELAECWGASAIRRPGREGRTAACPEPRSRARRLQLSSDVGAGRAAPSSDDWNGSSPGPRLWPASSEMGGLRPPNPPGLPAFGREWPGGCRS